MKGRVAWMVLLASILALSAGALPPRERWVYRYNGPVNNPDAAHSILMGADHNIYAAGFSCSWDTGTYYDFVVISLDPSGGQRWVYRFSGIGEGWEEATSIATGADSNVYAAGYGYGIVGAYEDFLVVSLTPSGGERWVYSYNGAGDWSDEALSIVMGTDGNLYAAGYTSGRGTSGDFTVISLSSSGGRRWIYRYSSPGGHMDQACSIIMGTDGNLYAAGYSYGVGTDDDIIVTSLDASGGERWVYRYDGPAGYWDEAHSIVMGTDGNVYAGGWSWGSGGAMAFTVISLTPMGAERWVYRYNGLGNGNDEVSAIATGTDGNLYVAGGSRESVTSMISDDFTVISLDTLGDERWVYRYNGPGSKYDWAYSIVMGTDGNLYAAGSSNGSGTGEDFTVISLDTLGDERWVYRYNGPGNYWDRAYSILMGTDGNLYAAGSSHGGGTQADIVVISLSPDVGVEEEPGARERALRPELKAPPSPIRASSGVSIYYSLPAATPVRVMVYDISGMLVKELIDTIEESGPKVVFWDARDYIGETVPSGGYFIRLETPGFSASRKLIVLR